MCLCFPLVFAVSSGCTSTPSVPGVRGSVPSLPVSAALEKRLHVCLVGVIDDLAKLRATHPQLAGFDPVAVKRQGGMNAVFFPSTVATNLYPVRFLRPNTLDSSGKPSEFPPLGFSYRHDVRGLDGKMLTFGQHGCEISVEFREKDLRSAHDSREFYRGRGILGQWDCIGPNVIPLRTRIEAILKEHAGNLEK